MARRLQQAEKKRARSAAADERKVQQQAQRAIGKGKASGKTVGRGVRHAARRPRGSGGGKNGPAGDDEGGTKVRGYSRRLSVDLKATFDAL